MSTNLFRRVFSRCRNIVLSFRCVYDSSFSSFPVSNVVENMRKENPLRLDALSSEGQLIIQSNSTGLVERSFYKQETTQPTSFPDTARMYSLMAVSRSSSSSSSVIYFLREVRGDKNEENKTLEKRANIENNALRR